MRLGGWVIRALATCVVAVASCVTAAAQSSPSTETWQLCTSREPARTDQAIEACSAIIAASRDGSEAAATAHGYRGIALMRRGSAQEREKAIADLEQAVGAGLESSIAYLFRGYLNLARQNFDRAMADYDESIRRDPQNRPSLSDRPRAAERHEARAAPENDNALREDRPDAAALVARAHAHVAKGDWSRAIADLDQALKLDSTSPLAVDAFATRATARYMTSDFAGAIADCDAALKLNPRHEQALKMRSFAHVAQATASSNGGFGALPNELQVYVAHGPAGACGPKCEDWLAVEGTPDMQGPRRLIAALDRLGTRKLPVVLNFRGRSNLHSAMSIGKILRERGFEVTVGQTRVDGCRDPLQAECIALKRSGKPVQGALIPSVACEIACVLSLAGGVRRTVPDITTVVIGGMWVGNRIGLEAEPVFREGRHVQYRDLIKVHLTQMGVDPRVADMMEEHYDSHGATRLSREDLARLRIVTAQ
jgi:lipoprotein NlpI